MIADILLEKALSIMATDHRVRKIKIFNDGLKLPFVVFGDLATEDYGDFFRLTHGAVGI